jgi:hypothetical protein
LFLLFVSIMAGAGRAQAVDDRANITPTAYRIFTGQTGSDIDSIVNQGFRIVDIRIDTPNGTHFTVTYVHNSGSYGTGWWYLIGMDAVGLGNFMTQNQARPTKLIAWDDGAGNTRFAAVMVPNSGAGARAWWWYHGVSSQTFFDNCVANNARPVSLDEYRIGTSTYVTGAMISNTGNDYRTWWMYTGQTFQDIGTRISQTGARLYTLQQNPNGGYNFILVQDNVGPWYYWVGLTSGQILDFAENNGLRCYEWQRLGSDSFLLLMLRNDNDLERRVGDIMRGASDGFVGVYLKKVNGPVLASLQGDRQFEPASTLKTLIHYHAMDQVRLGGASLGENVTVFTGTIGSCPQTNTPVTETLSTVLRLMMENSDNNRTMAAETRFGRATINATATILGMTSTSINHTMGCGGPVANRLTLRDIGDLHETVANGALGSQRTTFYNLMLEFQDNYAGGELNNVVNQEAAAVGLSASRLASFRTACRQAFKGGSYTFLGPTREFRSWGSWISLPFYTNGGIVAQEYVTGSFVDGASDGNNANTAFCRGAAEVLREEIRAAMITWRDHVFGTWTSFGTGCPGSNGQRPAHSGSPAAPTIAANVDWTLTNARSSAFTVLVLGYSNTNHAGTPLPANLTSAGMTNCTLYTEIFFTLYAFASSSGTRTFSATMPANPALLGSHTYSQYAVFDVGANPLGIAWSNAQDLVLGGQP